VSRQIVDARSDFMYEVVGPSRGRTTTTTKTTKNTTTTSFIEDGEKENKSLTLLFVHVGRSLTLLIVCFFTVEEDLEQVTTLVTNQDNG
jgi:hypothetical protein